MSVAELSRELAGNTRAEIAGIAEVTRVGGRRPSIVGHYLASRFRYARLQRSPRSDIEGIRAEFELHAQTGQFTHRWFDTYIASWCLTLPKVVDRDEPIRILEIGSWEGRSTLFLLTYFRKAELTCVDTWAGGDEHQHTAALDHLEERFDRNIAAFADRITKCKGFSSQVLPHLIGEKQSFDLVYVDGSHASHDVLIDGVTSWRMLRTGGVMIFDDFLWRYYPRLRDNPGWAITSLLKYLAGQFKILSVGYQLMLLKVSQ